MNQKPKIIFIFVILWIIIGVLFIGIAINRTLDYLDFIDIYDRSPGNFATSLTFSYIYNIIISIFLIIISFLLAYKSFIKKDLFWLLGLMFSSFLMSYVINGINLIANGILWENIVEMFSRFEFIAYILFIFLVPCQIFLLTRPEVKDYFGKRVVQTKEREIKTFNKMINKTIECPVCKETLEIQGILGERVEITCKKCKSKGFFNFR